MKTLIKFCFLVLELVYELVYISNAWYYKKKIVTKTHGYFYGLKHIFYKVSVGPSFTRLQW